MESKIYSHYWCKILTVLFSLILKLTYAQNNPVRFEKVTMTVHYSVLYTWPPYPVVDSVEFEFGFLLSLAAANKGECVDLNKELPKYRFFAVYKDNIYYSITPYIKFDTCITDTATDTYILIEFNYKSPYNSSQINKPNKIVYNDIMDDFQLVIQRNDTIFIPPKAINYASSMYNIAKH